MAGETPHDIRMDEPLAVRIGGHRVCKGIERALETWKWGESRTLLIPPEEGYGNADPNWCSGTRAPFWIMATI